MALQVVPPQCAEDSSPPSRRQQRDDSADAAVDVAAGQITPPSPATRPPAWDRCLLAAVGLELDPDPDPDHDRYSWITPTDMALLKALAGPDTASKACAAPLHQKRTMRLPRGTKPSKLIGEGSANAVFEFKVPRCNGAAHDAFGGLLLRVAKVPSLNHPPTYNYLAQQTFYQGAIKPLLGGHAIHQELVVLRNSGIVKELNKFLLENDHLRKDKFKGTFIGRADWGFLVEDMRPRDPDECVLVEFKPKWLSQSPSAPETAVRCRQCAMELRNLVSDPSRSRAMPREKPCPLALGCGGAPQQASSPFRIAPQLAGEEHFREALTTIANHPALHELKLQQDLHDKLGPLHAEPSDPYFIIAMTLRDCTCFVQVHRHSQSIKLRMGDFDRKDPLVKFERWRRAEQELIDGGFYTARWILCDRVFYRAPTLCALEIAPGLPSRRAEVLSIVDGPGPAADVSDDAAPVDQQEEADMKHYSHSTDAASLRQLLEPFRWDPAEAGRPSCET